MGKTCQLFRSSASYWAWWQSTQSTSCLKRLHHVYRLEIFKKSVKEKYRNHQSMVSSDSINVSSIRFVDTKVLSQQTRICWKWLIRFVQTKEIMIPSWHHRQPVLPHVHTSHSVFPIHVYSISTVATTAWTPSTHQHKDAERPELQHHMRLSGLYYLSHSAFSSSPPKPQCSFRNKAETGAEALISKQHPADSSILLRLDLHPAGRAVEDWASYWCNTPCDNIAPCCYDNATQCVRECCLSPHLLLV